MLNPDSGNALDNVRIVLVGTTHPGNIGAVARAMKTMGLVALDLVAPKHYPHAEATARASGADDILYRARVFETLAQALAGSVMVIGTTARERSLDWPEFTPREAAARLLSAARDAPVSVVFGREHSGLSNAELDHCRAMLRIPTMADFSSLNLASAVQILAWELRQMSLAGTPEPRVRADLPSNAEMEGFYAHLEATLVALDYFDPDKPKRLRRRLRRFFSRAAPDRPELNILRGILAAMQRRLDG